MEFDVDRVMIFNQKVDEPKGGAVAWSDDLTTGIDILDQQHRRYIDLLNDYLEKAARYSKTEEKAAKLLESFGFLLQYADEHFSTEESIMQDTQYPDFAPHQVEHEYFMKHVKALRRDMESNGFSEKIAREVNFYAIEWFIDHILGSDMQLVKFLKDRNFQVEAAKSTS